jgi:hypothetical protein
MALTPIEALRLAKHAQTRARAQLPRVVREIDDEIQHSRIIKMPPNQYGEQPTRTTYMVNNDVWREAGGEGLDTIDELEEKLGRRLVPQDFTTVGANWQEDAYNQARWPKEMENILDRQGGLEGKARMYRLWLERKQKHERDYEDWKREGSPRDHPKKGPMREVGRPGWTFKSPPQTWVEGE